MSEPKVNRLKSKIASFIVSAFALFSGAVALAGTGGGPDPADAPQPTRVLHLQDDSVQNTQSDRGIEDRFDNYFAHKPSLHVSRDGFQLTTPQRFDVHLLPVPEGGAIRITREYIEVKPLRNEWFGHANGFQYGVQADIGKGVTLGGKDWNLRSGFNFGYYDGPDRKVQPNTQVAAFFEGYRDVKINSFNGNLITGVSVNKVDGPELGRGTDTRAYAQLDMPAVFTHAKGTDKDSLGTFSATIKTYAGTMTYGGQLGVYFNNLKDGGNGVSFSAGPEVRYDKHGGVTYSFKVRVAPKIL